MRFCYGVCSSEDDGNVFIRQTSKIDEDRFMEMVSRDTTISAALIDVDVNDAAQARDVVSAWFFDTVDGDEPPAGAVRMRMFKDGGEVV